MEGRIAFLEMRLTAYSVALRNLFAKTKPNHNRLSHNDLNTLIADVQALMLKGGASGADDYKPGDGHSTFAVCEECGTASVDADNVCHSCGAAECSECGARVIGLGHDGVCDECRERAYAD